MKKLIAGVVLLVVAMTGWAAQTYTFSGSSFPACSNGGWSGSGTSANPYTCNGSFTLSSGDSISPNSSITIMANAGITLNGNNAVGSSSVTVNLQSTYGNISASGSGNTIYGSLSSSSGNVSLSGTAVYGGISTNGTVSLSGGSVSGSVTGSNGVTTTNGTTIGGDVTANTGSISLSGGSVSGAVHSDCCTVTTSNTNVGNGVSSTNDTVRITGGTISGTISGATSVSTSGGQGIIITNAIIASGNIVTNNVPITISGSTLGSPTSPVNVTGGNTVTITNGSTVYGNVSAPSWQNPSTVVDSSSLVYGTCTSSTTSTTDPGSYSNRCNGGNGGSGGTPGAFNAFETGTAAGAVTGVIYTKMAGSSFTLAIVAISNGAQSNSFNKNVSVSLVANQTPGSNYGSNNCPTSSTTVQSASSVSISGGRSNVTFAAVNSAYRDVRVLIQYPVSSPTSTACSTDSFAIRPDNFIMTSSNATNTATTGTPTFKAGSDAFNLTATTTTGYDGTPLLSSTAGMITGSTTAGSISGSFSAANNGAASGNFTYGEVGNFKLGTNAVSDQNFTSIDQKSNAYECTTDYSTTANGGMYGCYIGSVATTSAFGRFIPDHFTVLVTPACSASGKTPFTYSGQPFSVKVTAMNGFASPATTQNYNTTTGFSKQVTLSDVSSNSTGSSPTGALSPSTVSVASTAFASGIATTATPTFTFTLPVTPLPVPATLQVRATDSDGVNSAGVTVVNGSNVANDGSALVRLGRLRLFNAYGAVGTTVNMPMQTQYWSPDGVWVQNSDDSCTTVASGNVRLVSGSVAAQSGTVTMSGGAASLPLTATSTATISSSVAVNLGTGSNEQSCLSPNGSTPSAANEPWLRSQNGATGSCASLSGAALWQRDPSATATFGIFTPESRRMVHMRETFW